MDCTFICIGLYALQRGCQWTSVGTGICTSSSVSSVNLVAFIGSPLQALNLLEYKQRFALDVQLVVLEASAELEDCSRTQIEGVLSLVNPKKVIYVERGLEMRKLHAAHRALACGIRAIRSNLPDQPCRYIVGDYRSVFSWAVVRRLGVPPASVIVVDDGTATLRIDRQHSFPRSRDNLRLSLKRLIFSAARIPCPIPSAGLTFFTTYDLNDNVAPSDKVIRNDYRTLSAELRELRPDDTTVYVIGGDVSGPPALKPSLEVEIELALELVRFASNLTGKTVVYMAHRRERAEKLDVLRQEVCVVTPTVPFEIHPLVIGRRPRTIVGYYSSVFVTASELLGSSVQLIAVRIPRDRVIESWRPFVDEVYTYYRNELADLVEIREWLPE